MKSLVDRTTYLPAIDSYFQCESSVYWSATTGAGSTDYAWDVYFNYGNDYSHYKTDHDYVRCVRGGLSGSFGQFGDFAFDPISGSVDAGTCFPVRVEARNGSGALDTGFSGAVYLSANYGNVSPNALTFSNGVAVDSCVKVYGNGFNKQLRVQGWGRSGASHYFHTTGAGSCSARVEIHSNESGATVTLDDMAGVEAARDDTNGFNNVVFNNIPCGSYTLEIEKNGFTRTDNSPLNILSNSGVYRRSLYFPIAGVKRPVILIPGMMGSTHRGVRRQLTPYLESEEYPDRDLAIHLRETGGWKKLQEELEGDGYTVIRCPWDWRSESRESMKQNVEAFLKPAIEEALQYYSVDDKVNIVAHSMGGLLARAYIQDDDLYRDDVSKLALVAVPNLGSVNPYFLWEGGDTATTKEVLGSLAILGGQNVYNATIKKLWKKTYGKKNWKSCEAKDIRDFINNVGPGMLQLMSTEKFLTRNGSSVRVTTSGNENTWLKALNNGEHGFDDPEDVFSDDDSDNSKVRTRVFIGNQGDDSTLSAIVVGSPAEDDLYKDGTPYAAGSLDCGSQKPTGVGIGWGEGDGTVPLASARDPLSEDWADREVKISSEDHFKITKDFTSEIKGFLDGTRAGTTALEVNTPAIIKEMIQASESETPMLSFSMLGAMRLVVTDSQGRRSGITADTSEVVNEIPDTEIDAGDATASVVIQNPAAGQYTLTYYGYADNDFSLYITAFNSGGEGNEKSFTGFRPDGAQAITITYNPLIDEQIVVQPVVRAPLEMETEAYSCGANQCTRVKWKASPSPGVSQYVVYRSLANVSFFTEFARVVVGVTSYDTAEPWDGVNGYPVNAYNVSAIKADTTESFFAEEPEMIDYFFPWPMFLPAINGGK